jgi:hypothetical protein
MELFYQNERDKDFFETCESIRKEYGAAYISVDEIAEKAIFKEASSFYLKTEVYARIYNKIKNWKAKPIRGKVKDDLYHEVLKRYKTILSDNPDMNAMEVARIIATQKAPRFYMSRMSARNLYYKLLKNNPK